MFIVSFHPLLPSPSKVQTFSQPGLLPSQALKNCITIFLSSDRPSHSWSFTQTISIPSMEGVDPTRINKIFKRKYLIFMSPKQENIQYNSNFSVPVLSPIHFFFFFFFIIYFFFYFFFSLCVKLNNTIEVWRLKLNLPSPIKNKRLHQFSYT